MAPFALTIAKSVGLSKSQLGALLLANLALAVPGRVLVGRLLDRFGPRKLYGGLLIGAFVPNTIFALSHSFATLVVSRLLLGLVGSGFVIGIRLVSEWFENKEIGIAEGIYGGWGNFGSAAAALLLPTIATAMVHGPNAWRFGVFLSGALGAIYGVVFLVFIRDTPPGNAYLRPKSIAALSVSSRKDVFGLIFLQLPLVVILGIVASRLGVSHVLSPTGVVIAYIVLTALFVYQVGAVLQTNKDVVAKQVSLKPYPFRAVVILSMAYAVTFGTELTMVSLLPTYFGTTFGLKIAAAGIAGSAFAFTNLVTRPGGGLLSDVLGNRTETLRVFLIGAAATFILLAQLNKSWPLAAGIGAIALASVFIQGGNGAVFAMVPLVRKDVTGQIAGLVGAYGNFGGLALASILFYSSTKKSVGDVHLVFIVVAVAALAVAVLTKALPASLNATPAVLVESAGSNVEFVPDEEVAELI